ncbi:MAG: hypothetical protein M1511_18510 [Deltaproteobacteria bacterium]|nr:hypothetical protein [Deltaproteobacteria bacterium]
MKLILSELRHDFNGFLALTQLYAQTRDCLFDEIQIDMKQTSWFDADMCAAFGAILYSIGDNVNSISLINIPQNVEKILSKNGFLGNYGRNRI